MPCVTTRGHTLNHELNHAASAELFSEEILGTHAPILGNLETNFRKRQ